MIASGGGGRRVGAGVGGDDDSRRVTESVVEPMDALGHHDPGDDDPARDAVAEEAVPLREERRYQYREKTSTSPKVPAPAMKTLGRWGETNSKSPSRSFADVEEGPPGIAASARSEEEREHVAT